MRHLKLLRKGKGIVLWCLLAGVVLWSFFPILYLAATSFKPATEVFSYPPLAPSRFSVENYARLLKEWPGFWDSLVNSLLITTVATGLTIGLSVPAAYAVSRFRNRPMRLFTAFTIIIRMFPPIIISIPLFPFLRYLKLIDSRSVVIVLYTAFMVSLITLITRSLIDEVPLELEDAALIDGCSPVRVLIRIVLPLIGPSVAATAVITAVFCWNEFLFAFLFTATRSRTAPIMISEMLGSFLGVDWGVLFAATTIQLAPILLFTLLVQKYLVKGLTLGAVKG